MYLEDSTVTCRKIIKIANGDSDIQRSKYGIDTRRREWMEDSDDGGEAVWSRQSISFFYSKTPPTPSTLFPRAQIHLAAHFLAR